MTVDEVSKGIIQAIVVEPLCLKLGVDVGRHIANLKQPTATQTIGISLSPSMIFRKPIGWVAVGCL
ncbi:MAG: hypothetical protein AAFQ89_09730, partial [Cyanobacteria bacterium J06626_18]